MLNDTLTSEHLSSKSGNTFDLVNRAIESARNKIRSGRECYIANIGVINQAYQVLQEYAHGFQSDLEEKEEECEEE